MNPAGSVPDTGIARVTQSRPPDGPSGAADRAIVNNSFYDDLGDRWHEAYDDPVALLRAEGALKTPWIAARIRSAQGGLPARILDIGCGAGFQARAFAAEGHRVFGLDLSVGSLKTARKPGPGVPPAYLSADAYRLPFPDACFDAVCALDFLEHVTAPARVVAEAARVLRPSGSFFFHTFNRNLPAWLIVIKGVELFVRNTPERMHVLRLFLKPAELRAMCDKAGMRVEEMTGMRPVIGSAAFWKLLLTRRVPRDFRFRFTPSLALSYLGCARKLPLRS